MVILLEALLAQIKVQDIQSFFGNKLNCLMNMGIPVNALFIIFATLFFCKKNIQVKMQKLKRRIKWKNTENHYIIDALA